MERGEIIVLRASRTKWLLIALASLGFVLASTLLTRSDGVFWPGALFFGLCLVTSLICLLSRAACLKLAPEGMTVSTLFRSDSFLWTDVREFGVGRVMAGPEMVGFNFEDHASASVRSPKLRKLNRRLFGFDAGLPDNYGLKHEQLAALLTRYKASAR